MDMPKEFLDMINEDISKIQEMDRLSLDMKIDLHQRIYGRYSACIRDWQVGLAGVNGGRIAEWYLNKYPTECRANLLMMQSKLETYRYGMNAFQTPEAPSQSVTVNTNVNVSVTFEQVREQIEDMTALTNEQTQEILDKINEIESVVNSTDKKKTKWEKIKPVLVWLADKSCDVGVALLPLLLKI